MKITVPEEKAPRTADMLGVGTVYLDGDGDYMLRTEGRGAVRLGREGAEVDVNQEEWLGLVMDDVSACYVVRTFRIKELILEET